MFRLKHNRHRLFSIALFCWFTQRVDDEDPCEKFKSQLDRMKKAR